MIHSRWQHHRCHGPRARHASAHIYCTRRQTTAIEGVTGTCCFTAGGSIASATVPRGRHVNALVYCIRGPTIADEGVPGSWYFTAGGRIASAQPQEQDTTRPLFTVFVDCPLQSKVTQILVHHGRWQHSRYHCPKSKTRQCP